MSIGEVTALLRQSVIEVLRIASPLMLSALGVGLIIAILQAATSIQEQTLTIVPKIFTILLMLALLGGWMFNSMRDYTMQLFMQIPNMAR